MAGSGIFKVTKPDFQASVQKMMEENRIWGVQKKSPYFIFEDLRSVEDLCLGYNIALLPPNKFFLPSKEPLIDFDLVTKESSGSNSGDERSIILGIHAYDMHALKNSGCGVCRVCRNCN